MKSSKNNLKQESLFKTRVIEVIKNIPYGRVMSYGQVALIVGTPRAARQVGGILNSSEESLPWWRVVNKIGEITIKGAKSANKELQRKLLRAEGIEVDEDFILEIEHYRYHPSESQLKHLELPKEYIEFLLTKI